jgi:hypothetical protein
VINAALVRLLQAVEKAGTLKWSAFLRGLGLRSIMALAFRMKAPSGRGRCRFSPADRAAA